MGSMLFGYCGPLLHWVHVATPDASICMFQPKSLFFRLTMESFVLDGDLHSAQSETKDPQICSYHREEDREIPL